MATRPLAPLTARPSAVLDANVLIAPFLRDVLLQLAYAGLYDARWTDEITEEWMRNARAKWPGATAAKLRRTAEVMKQSFPDACVRSYKRHLPRVQGVDAKDQHVAAAALEVAGRTSGDSAIVIVTANLRDFPEPVLAEVGLVATDPDSFVIALLRFAPKIAFPTLREHRVGLKNPPFPVDRYCAACNKSGLVETARVLAANMRLPERTLASSEPGKLSAPADPSELVLSDMGHVPPTTEDIQAG